MIGQSRTSQRYRKSIPQDERRLIDQMHRPALKWPRYGYRRITVLLRQEGWRVNVKRVHRLWKAEGLQIRKKSRKRRRLGTGDNACHRRKPLARNHVWSYDFVSERTEGGGRLRMLNIVDEFTRECLAIEIRRHSTGKDVVAVLAELFAIRGRPGYIRSDNGPEFASKAVKRWLKDMGVGTLFIEPGSPWENGYVESFNGKLRDELLDREIFYTLWEAQVLVEQWRRTYNQLRPHSSLGYRPPAPEAIRPAPASLTRPAATARPMEVLIPRLT